MWLFKSLLIIPCLGIFESVQSADGQLVTFHNQAGVDVALGWINPEDRSAVPMQNIRAGKYGSVQSHEGHEFELREVPSAATGLCGDSSDKTCKVGYLTLKGQEDQQFVVYRGLQIVPTRAKTKNAVAEDAKPHELIANCQAEVLDRIKRSGLSGSESELELNDFHDCMTNGVTPALMQVATNIEFEKQVRNEVSEKLENFTCADPDAETSPDIDERTWSGARDGVERMVHVKLDRPASRIHVIENFASPTECKAIEEEAKPRLGVATTADNEGGHHVSIHRKALQADIEPRWHREASGDLIAGLSRRIYDYTNHVLGTNVTEAGQEPLMSIQYFGRGAQDGEPDRYTPHCDGMCEGREYLSGSRMATMVVYCTIPEKGGHTNFGGAYVHVKPVLGSAIFFSYLDPETELTDYGLTQHSGCPVYEGEKRIITQWVRRLEEGRSHEDYNSLEVLKSDDH